MVSLVWVSVWLLIAVYAFFAPSPEEDELRLRGRRLLGWGALLIAGVLAVPEGGPGVLLGDLLGVLGTVVGSLLLVAGLVLSLPASWVEAGESLRLTSVEFPEENTADAIDAMQKGVQP
ncbi:hypothetical protein LLH03_14395 [bacterium]|nr:hypothetical protein [bacterium]